VILGSADGLSNLVETLGLPLDKNANATIVIGMAAEDHAAAQLQADHPGVAIMRG
jgi:hypothetical protein